MVGYSNAGSYGGGGGGGSSYTPPVSTSTATTTTATSTPSTGTTPAPTSREGLLAQIQILLAKVQELRNQLNIQTGQTSQRFTQDLEWGMKNNAEVRLLQTVLTTDGVYTGPITGNFLSLTYRAVVKFQTKYNISPAAGYVGAKTRGVLNGM